MKRSESIKELAAALSKAQKGFESAERSHTARVQTRTGGEYSFNYADLAAYLDVCREALGSNGLSVMQEPTVRATEISVTTLLMHESGESIESEPLTMAIIPQGTDQKITPQAIGSAITYARRYALSAFIGMASEADDDGNAASGNNAQTGPKAMPACPKCGNTTAVIKGKAEYGGGFVCWKNKNGCGHSWQPDAEPKPVDPTIRTNAMTLLSAAVLQGKEALDQAYKMLSPEQRQAVAADIGGLQKQAANPANQEPEAVGAWRARMADPDAVNVAKLNEWLPEIKAIKDKAIRTKVWNMTLEFAEKYNCIFDEDQKAFYLRT